MTKAEFEKLAMRGNETIGEMMYESVEYFYMSENEYHMHNGGIDESKQEFVKRVFGGKVNTPKTIAHKLALESIRENRYALRGNSSVTKQELDRIDDQIIDHYETMLKYGM